MTGSAIFLDTSIQIARFFHAKQTKTRIENRIALYSICATSLVVRQEFKKRIMGEARYLSSLFRRWRSYTTVQRWVSDVLPAQWNRKKQICLDLLETVGEVDGARESDFDITERAQVMLEGLLEYGLEDFDNSVDHQYNESGCYCGLQSVRIDEKGRVDLGIAKCSDTSGKCKIGDFLGKNAGLLESIRESLTSIPDLTRELTQARDFITGFLMCPRNVERYNPCTTVGDLLIALESRPVDTFYTLNEKESKVLCPCMGQLMIIRPVNFTQDDRLEDFRPT